MSDSPQTADVQDDLPVSGSEVASLEKEVRRSAKEMAKYFYDQYQAGLKVRRRHAIAWTMVRLFRRGIHYFIIDDTGSWERIRREKGEIRAVVPVIVPMHRHVLGFLNANAVGATAVPVSGGSQSLYRSNRAEAAISGWIDETDFQDVFDRANGVLLSEGMVGYYRYVDAFRQNVFVKDLPQSELFPIPYDARSIGEASGLMHASLVTKEWTELQDDNFERMKRRPPKRKMSEQVSRLDSGLNYNYPGLGMGASGGRLDGALALTVWMKKTEQIPTGEYCFLLNDEMYRYAGGYEDQRDQQGNPVSKTRYILDQGEIPVELAYFDKDPGEFYGRGMDELLIPSQLSWNRTMTNLEMSVRKNMPLSFFDSDVINMNDIQNEEAPAIPVRGSKLETSDRKPIWHIPAQRVGQDSLAVMELHHRLADQAAGMRSGVAFGEAEGRVEGGPGVAFLGRNALASLNSVFSRLAGVHRRTYYGVLDMLRYAWPEEKTVRIVGPSNVGREMKILRSELPWSRKVILNPRPILAGGRETLASVLFQLRQMPGPDGKAGTEITSREFRRSLVEMGLLPPGLELEDRAESRIQTRINGLIGDGKKPTIAPASEDNYLLERFVMEKHHLAVEMLKNVILDDSFEVYSQPVQKSLLQELDFHHKRTYNATEHPDEIDDDGDKLASLQMQEFMRNAEMDLDTEEGQMLSMV